MLKENYTIVINNTLSTAIYKIKNFYHQEKQKTLENMYVAIANVLVR